MKEFVRWKDPRFPNMPPTWSPIDRKKGTVTTGSMICNNPPKGKVVGEMRFSGEAVFSTPIVRFYEEHECEHECKGAT